MLDIFRGVPFLVVLYLTSASPRSTRRRASRPRSWAVALNLRTPRTWPVRAGLDSAPQRYAARSLGLSPQADLRMIIVPRAIRKVTPA